MPQHASPALIFQKGIITMSTLQVNATVTFTTPIDVAYDVYFQTPPSVAVNLTLASFDRTGFTINLGLAIGSQTLRWYAVQQQ